MAALRVFLCLMLACFAQAAFAAEEGGILYGPNHAVDVSAPPGWVLDNKSGVVNGVYAAIYPEGGSWAGSPAVMYANCSAKNAQSGATLEDFVKNDAEVFKKPDPDILIKKLDDDYRAGKTSVGMYFDNKVNKEAVVYVDEEKVVCMLVLSSKTDKDYTASLPAYKTFLGSYKFITSHVELPKDPPQPDPKKDPAQPELKGGIE